MNQEENENTSTKENHTKIRSCKLKHPELRKRLQEKQRHWELNHKPKDIWINIRKQNSKKQQKRAKLKKEKTKWWNDEIRKPVKDKKTKWRRYLSNKNIESKHQLDFHFKLYFL